MLDMLLLAGLHETTSRFLWLRAIDKEFLFASQIVSNRNGLIYLCTHAIPVYVYCCFRLVYFFFKLILQ